MYNSMCFRVHFTSISTVVFFIFQRTVHPRVLYFRELFTPGFYTSENCSPQGIIFQRTVHPRFLYFRELFTPGFYISENCSPLGFSGVRVAHSLPFCVMFCQPTCFLNMVIVFSDLLAITVFDDHFWYLQAFLKYCT